MAAIGHAPRGRSVTRAIPRALPRPRAHLRVGRLLQALLVLLALGALAGLGQLQVFQSSETAAVGYQVRALEADRAHLSAQVRTLEAEIAEMMRIEDIETAAKERLGMVPPQATVQVAVGVPAPTTLSLPQRYVAPQESPVEEELAWWERVLGRLSGLR